MRHLLFVVTIFICAFANAQMRITDTFDSSGVLDWNEYANKEKSALIMMGMLNLEVHKAANVLVYTETDLPIQTEYDFKISSKLIVPKIESDEIFGILFDMDEKFNRLAFVFTEDKFIACNLKGGKFDFENSYENLIKLPKAKDKNMEIVLEQKGGKLIVSYDNMEVLKQKRKINSPIFGFITTSKLQIDEVVLEQEYVGN